MFTALEAPGSLLQIYEMRTVAEYLDKAAEFDALARAESHPSLKKRYADLAECYRMLAAERQRLIGDKTLQSDPPLRSH
jgi:hypothetical protein